MQDRPLVVPNIFDRAERLFGHKRIVTGSVSGEPQVTTYARWSERVRRLAGVLDALAVSPGARVGTFAANNQQHLEVYFATPCTGRVLHTINIRLPLDHLRYIVRHAADEVMFVDRALLPVMGPLIEELDSVRHWIVVDDGSDHPVPTGPRVHDYEQLLADCRPFAGEFDFAAENAAAGLCYTSGTTGRPKGVLYSHRSTVLHCLMTQAAGLLGLHEADTVMPVVPMFHVNAWGLPYGAVMAGADLVLPGPSAAPEHLLSLIERHRVTMTAAVPTVWSGCAPLLGDYDLSSLRLVLGGGSAISPALSERWRSDVGIPITHSWGMTEASPVAVIGGLRSNHTGAEEAVQIATRAAQGQPVPLVRLRLVDESGGIAPRDGQSAGELQVAGPWIASGYYDEDATDSFTADGWLRTGDVATIDAQGYVRIVDRVKDMIKSGGEWISSIDLENAITSHAGVAEAAVVAIRDPKWVERPAAYVVRRPGVDVTVEDLLGYLRGRVAKWWLPDQVIFLDELPKTGTGKISKATLRQRSGA